MPFKYLFFFIPFLLLSLSSIGQKRNTPLSTTKNFTSYRLGLDYPFYSEGNQNSEYSIANYNYQFSHKSLNYGFLGGLGIGHYFNPTFSIELSIYATYSKFANSNFHYESTTNPYHELIYEENGELHFSHLSLLFPLNFNIRIKPNLDFGAGVFIMKPVLDHEYKESSGV